MAAGSPTSRQLRWAKAVRWGIGIFVLAGLAGWLLNRPDPLAMQRQKVCEFWGITDRDVLAKCRQSPELESAAIEPFKRAVIERDVAEFNQDLSALTSGKTQARDSDYPSRSVEEVAKVTGGMAGSLILKKDAATFPANGQRVKLFGIIVTHEPDPDDSSESQEPRHFTLETETHQQVLDTKAVDKVAIEVFMSTQVNLDIESLNRHERQFIVDHCQFLSVTPCRATVLGHIGEIVGRSSVALSYMGVVADQVDVEPLDSSKANQNGMPLLRSLLPPEGAR